MESINKRKQQSKQIEVMSRLQNAGINVLPGKKSTKNVITHSGSNASVRIPVDG